MSERSTTPSKEDIDETKFVESADQGEGNEEAWPLISSDEEKRNKEDHGEERAEKVARWRNVAAFWLFGLCNNFSYVIMLSAAFDILSQLDRDGHSQEEEEEEMDMFGNDNLTRAPEACRAGFNATTNSSRYKARYCNTKGTSVILLADILPTLIIKFTFPYFMNFAPYWLRVIVSIVFSVLSYVLVGLSLSVALVVLGVVCASIGSGFGELTFLSYTAHFHKSTVSGWASGTGAAGIGAALTYAGLRLFFSPRVTILLQLVVPAVQLFAFLFLLSRPETEEDKTPLVSSSSWCCWEAGWRWEKLRLINWKEAKLFVGHVKYIPHLFKYMVPLYVVYISEYMINQGLFELLYYPNTSLGSICLDQQAQYRWYQVIYQLGVFVSRTSTFFFRIKWFWILSILQAVNFILFFLEAIFFVLPSFWIMFFLVLYEGLLGGGVYVNAFYSITKQVPEIHREFSMGVASVADSSGITSAAVASIFIHNFICHNYVSDNS